MMRTRGWLLLAAMVLSAQCALATDASNVFDGYPTVNPGDPVSAAQQEAIAIGYAAVVGSDVAQTMLIESSRGTLLNAVNEAIQAGPATTKAAIDGLLVSATSGDSGALSVLSGVSATSGVDAGSATTSAIGGGGGVIAGRQSGLMAERKAMGNVDSALASFKMNQNFANRVWASPFYTRQGMDTDKGYSGYDYSGWGASVGYDHVFGAFVAGASFTYSRGDFDADDIADDNTTDNYGFSLYGQYYNTANGVFVTLAGGYNYGDNETRINAGTGIFTSDGETDSYWFGANVGKDIFLNENWTFTPSVGLFWSQSESASYTERFNNAAFRNFNEMTSESVLMPIDLKVEYTTMIDDCSSLSFNVAGGYAYNWKKDGGRAEGSFNYVGTGTNVFVQGADGSRNNWNIGTGVTYRRNNFDVGVNYRYDGKSKFDGHRVAATVGWNF